MCHAQRILLSPAICICVEGYKTIFNIIMRSYVKGNEKCLIDRDASKWPVMAELWEIVYDRHVSTKFTILFQIQHVLLVPLLKVCWMWYHSYRFGYVIYVSAQRTTMRGFLMPILIASKTGTYIILSNSFFGWVRGNVCLSYKVAQSRKLLNKWQMAPLGM